MKTIFENKYLSFGIDIENAIFLYAWKSTSEEMALDELFIEAQRILEAVLQNKVRCIISQDTDFKFLLVPEIQSEMNKKILSVLNNSSVKKFAHIQSTQIISQLGVEQFFDENINKTYEDKYFDNLTDALSWCK